MTSLVGRNEMATNLASEYKVTKLKCRMLIQNEFLGLSSEHDLTSTPKLSAPSIPRGPGVTDSTQHVANQPETTQGLQEATSCFQVLLQLIILVEPC